jgi:hypothetical protein
MLAVGVLARFVAVELRIAQRLIERKPETPGTATR